MTKAEQPTITQALKPCPFCGGEVYTEHHTEWFNSGTEFRGYSVTCDKCNMRFGTDNQLKGSHKDHTEGDFASDDAAIAAWNTRPSLAAQDGLVEALRFSLKLAANRFDRLGVNAIADGRAAEAHEISAWSQEARATARVEVSAIKGDKS